jgi:hypothetical protein
MGWLGDLRYEALLNENYCSGFGRYTCTNMSLLCLKIVPSRFPIQSNCTEDLETVRVARSRHHEFRSFRPILISLPTMYAPIKLSLSLVMAPYPRSATPKTGPLPDTRLV